VRQPVRRARSIAVTFLLGVTIGGISGYFGGATDRDPARDRDRERVPADPALAGVGPCCGGVVALSPIYAITLC